MGGIQSSFKLASIPVDHPLTHKRHEEIPQVKMFKPNLY